MIKEHAHGTNKEYIKKKKSRCISIIKQYKKKMISYDDVTKENIKEGNPDWPEIFDHPCKTLIVGVSGSGKTKALLNLIKQQNDDDYIIDIFLYVKDPNEAQYQYLIKKNLKKWSWDPKAFTDYSNNIQDVYYKYIEEYNPDKKCKVLTVIDDLMANMINNKKLEV